MEAQEVRLVHLPLYLHSANLFPVFNGSNYYDIVKDKSRSSHGTHFRPYSMKKADDIVSPAHLLLRKQVN